MSDRKVPQPYHCQPCRAKEVYEFAYTYPYSYSQLQRWLLTWQRVQLPYLQRHLLCRTPHMKRMDVLVIEDASIDVGQSVLQCTCLLVQQSTGGYMARSVLQMSYKCLAGVVLMCYQRITGVLQALQVFNRRITSLLRVLYTWHKSVQLSLQTAPALCKYYQI